MKRVLQDDDGDMLEKEKKPADRIALNITGDKKRFCNICDSELLPDYSCGKCGVYYMPEQARHEIKIMGLDGKEPGIGTNTIPIASVDTTPDKKKQKMAPLFEAMQKQGFRFTSYTSTNE